MTILDVAYVLERIGATYGVNLLTENITNECNGCVFGTDSPLNQFLAQHALIYDYQPVDEVDDDGSPLTVLRRRPVGLDLTIDLEITENECIKPQSGPVVQFPGVDPLSLPRAIELQYFDPARDYNTNTQLATWPFASIQCGKRSVTSNFVHSAEEARLLAFDILFRMRQRRPLIFEHPNPNIQPADVLNLVMRDGSAYIVLVQTQVLTKQRTSQIVAATLLTSRGITIAAGAADEFLVSGLDFISNASAIGVGNTRTVTNKLATKSTGEPDHAGNAGGHSVWWRFTAPVLTGGPFDYAVSTDGSEIDTLLAVYTLDELDVLTEVASNDDAGITDPTSYLTFTADEGVTYYIAVDGKDGAVGKIVLSLDNAPTP